MLELVRIAMLWTVTNHYHIISQHEFNRSQTNLRTPTAKGLAASHSMR